MEETLTMSNREIDRLRVVRNVLERKLTWEEGSQQLKICMRQVGYLCERVRKEGNRGMIHRLRGKPSNNRLESELIEKAIEIVKTQYSDFGPTFANEKLANKHQIHISTFALRQAMIRAGLWHSRELKPKHRVWRPRRPCLGMMVQLDGSDHDWFEGRGPRCVLLIFIDDATSQILHAVFIPVEDTYQLLQETKQYMLTHGRPISFYVDKDSIYKINRQASVEEQLRDSSPLSQFTRAMKELDVNMIFANSPQAKGRVERGFKTHQDRLVKELRLAGISSIKPANRFLLSTYIPEHNARFTVQAQKPSNAHRRLLPTHKLDRILSIQVERTLLNDWTLRFQNRFFQILKEQPVPIRPKAKVTVELHLDGSTHLRYKDRLLSFKTLPRRPYRPLSLARVGGQPRYVPKPNSLQYARLIHISP